MDKLNLNNRYENLDEELIGRMTAGLQSISAALWRGKDLNVPKKDVNFYDHDGKCVKSYTKKEFMTLASMPLYPDGGELSVLAEMPAYPNHEGLTAQGWNWSMQEAQEYVRKYGSCEIGQMFCTEDQKTKLYIEILETETKTVTLRFRQSAVGAVTVDWGDMTEAETEDKETEAAISHTYARSGKYVITLEVAEDEEAALGLIESAEGDMQGVALIAFGTGESYAGRNLLHAVEIGGGVAAVNCGAFRYAWNLKRVTMPYSLGSIGAYAFDGCVNLAGMVIPYGVKEIGEYAFRDCIHMRCLCLPEGLESIGEGAAKGCVCLGRASVPEGVEAIPDETFSGCSSVGVVSVPDSVVAYGEDSFKKCYGLQAVRFPFGVTSVPRGFAEECRDLRVIEMPYGVETIGENAFLGAYIMNDVTVPATVISIGSKAFGFADGKMNFVILAKNVPAIAADTFPELGDDSTVTVPWSADHSILAAYKTAENWSAIADKIVEEEEPAWYGITVKVTLAAAWINGDSSHTWPDGVEVQAQLTADGENVDGASATLDADNASHVFTGLKKYTGNHDEIAYSMSAGDVNGYTAEVGQISEGVVTVTYSAI